MNIVMVFWGFFWGVVFGFASYLAPVSWEIYTSAEEWILTMPIWVLASGIIGSVYEVAREYRLQLQELKASNQVQFKRWSERDDFLRSYFGVQERALNLLKDQALICEEASQKVVKLQREGIPGCSPEYFDQQYGHLTREFQREQKMFYELYDFLDLYTTIRTDDGGVAERSFKAFLP